MIVGIQGTSSFNDYSVFLRAMGVALQQLPEGDKEFTVMSAGPLIINRFALEFLNISERSLKARGIKVKLVKVPSNWFKTNMNVIGYFAYFSKPKEPVSDLVDLADSKDIEVGVYRF
jgi:hypothetical protein